MRRYTLLIIGLTMSLFSFGQMAQMRCQIEKIIENRDLELGFALHELSCGDTLSINGQRHFPMQSVYKFPIALAVLDAVDRGRFSLHEKVRIEPKDLQTQLWSPIAKRYANGGVKLSLSEVLKYTVAQSDNLGCDLLLRLLGGACVVNDYIHSKGITDISIKNTEQEIQSSWGVQFENYTTPEAMIELLKLFNDKELLQPKTHDFLWRVMSQTSTGSVRNRLPKDALVLYKTGTSGYNSENISAATNCVGLLVRPNAERVAFAIFITNSKESVQVNADVIAKIAQLIYTSR